MSRRCVIDRRPRTLDTEQLALLCNFAEMAVREMEKDKLCTLKRGDSLVAEMTADGMHRAAKALTQGVFVVDVTAPGWKVLLMNDQAASFAGGMQTLSFVDLSFQATFHAQRKQKQKLLKLLHLVSCVACRVSLQCVSSMLLQCLASQTQGTRTGVHLSDGKKHSFPIHFPCKQCIPVFAEFTQMELVQNGRCMSSQGISIADICVNCFLNSMTIACNIHHCHYTCCYYSYCYGAMQALIGSSPKGRASGASSSCPQAKAIQRTCTPTPSARAWSSVSWLPAPQSSTACHSHSGQLGTVSAQLTWPKVLSIALYAHNAIHTTQAWVMHFETLLPSRQLKRCHRHNIVQDM